MTDATADGPLALYRALAELERDADRLLVATARRTVYEDALARHDEDELAEIGDEPPVVAPAQLLAYHRRKVETLRAAVEAGVPDSREALDEAEQQLADLKDGASAPGPAGAQQCDGPLSVP